MKKKEIPRTPSSPTSASTQGGKITAGGRAAQRNEKNSRKERLKSNSSPVIERGRLPSDGLEPRRSVDVTHGRHPLSNARPSGRRDGHEGGPVRGQVLEPLARLLGEYARREGPEVFPALVWFRLVSFGFVSPRLRGSCGAHALCVLGVLCAFVCVALMRVPVSSRLCKTHGRYLEPALRVV